jgi:hypothetical protein
MLEDQTFGQDNVDYPVFDYLCEKYNVKSMVDIGCGWGGMVNYSMEQGVKSLGIDFSNKLNMFDKDEFLFHDYTTGEYVLDETYDLGWSVEFLEHVEEEYLDNIFSTFSCCKIICCTHALPNQPGIHHVNCRKPTYWIDVFKEYGFRHDIRSSFHVKLISEMKDKRLSGSVLLHMKRTGMILINKNLF